MNSYFKNPIQVGYACLNKDIVNNSYKTCRIENVSSDKLYELIKHNLNVLEETIDYNITHNNKMYRLSSSLIPFASLDVMSIDWEFDFKDTWLRIAQKIKEGEIRISMHPGQYTVLNSPTENVVENSIKELEYHVKVLKLLGGNSTHKIILHIGGIYGDKKEAINRFIHNYSRLEGSIKEHLVIENDDRLYTLEDVLYISSKTKIPVVFDNLHHEINPSLSQWSTQECILKVLATWSSKDGRPKMHYSQQDSTKKPGSHSNTIYIHPFLKDYAKYFSSFAVDVMLEVKDKNRSFEKISLLIEPNQIKLEKVWAAYKYWVMSYSYKEYQSIRKLFKNNQWVDPIDFFSIIDHIHSLPFSIPNFINTCEHVWGYFKKLATPKEKDKFFDLLVKVKERQVDPELMRKYLKRLSIKYEVIYLLQTYFINP